jgi:hypothetical protein
MILKVVINIILWNRVLLVYIVITNIQQMVEDNVELTRIQ